MKHQHVLIAICRWEAGRIAEWLSYHRSIGYEHAYIYNNDEDPSDLYNALIPFICNNNPFVTYYHNRAQGMQRWSYLHCFENHGDEFEWFSLFDIDEYLSIRRFKNINDFVLSYGKDIECIYVNWTFFGHSGQTERNAGSVLLNYVYRQDGLDPHTKVITKMSAVQPNMIREKAFRPPEIVRFNHGWDESIALGMRRINVLGDDMSHYYEDFSKARPYILAKSNEIFSTAVLHHYAFQSENDFARRMQRGVKGDQVNQLNWGKIIEQNDTERFLSTINAVKDKTLHDYWNSYISMATLSSVLPIPKGHNIALNCPTRQSSAAPSIELLPGGATSGTLSATASFCTELQETPWWDVDLGCLYNINEIVIFNRLDEHANRSANIQIWISLESDEWSHVFRKDDGVPFGGVDGNPLIWSPERSIIARYVRISLLGTNYLHLNQVEVYGVPILPG